MIETTFFILSINRKTSKDGNAYAILELYKDGTLAQVYVPADNLNIIDGLEPKQEVKLAFKLKNAYQSKDLQIELVSQK